MSPKPAIGTEEVDRQRRGSRDGGRGSGRILILREVRHSVGRRVEIDLRVQVATLRADKRHVEGRRPRQLHLHTHVVAVHRGDLALVVERRHRRRRIRSAGGVDLLQPSVEEVRLVQRRRLLDHAVDGIAGRAIVEDTRTAAHHKTLVAARVVGKPESRRVVDAAVLVELFVDPLAGAVEAVADQRARSRHQPADVDRGHHRPRRAVQADTVAGGVACRVVQARRFGRVVLLGNEVRRLETRVVGRLQPIEAHAIVERQAGVHSPVVLHVPLDVVIQEIAFEPLGSLRIGLVHANRRIREREAGVERVRRIIHEADDAVGRGAAALFLHGAIHEEPHLAGVRAEQLRHTRHQVIRRVVVLEGSVLRVVDRRVVHAAAGSREHERRHQVLCTALGNSNGKPANPRAERLRLFGLRA